MKTFVFVVDYNIGKSQDNKTYIVPLQVIPTKESLAEGFKTANLLCRKLEYPAMINITRTKYVKTSITN